jgi:hypothetical protein
LPIPADACHVFGGPQQPLGAPVEYRLRRVRVPGGCAVWLHLGNFSWNLSRTLGHYPATFAGARAWVTDYAAAYGQTVVEAPPLHPRWPQPDGEDRKLLRAGGCREGWLSSAVPALWAEAMTRCQCPAADCGKAGLCRYGHCDMIMDAMPAHPAVMPKA